MTNVYKVQPVSASAANESTTPQNDGALLPGETRSQMEWARSIAARAGLDTSIDEEWQVEPWAAVDYFVWAVLILALTVKLLAMFLPLMLLLAPAVVSNHIYATCVSREDRIQDGYVGWSINIATQWLLSLPAQLVIVLMLGLDLILIGVFGGIWCTFTCSWGRFCRNGEALAPFSGGPSLYAHFGDIVAASAGESVRLGLCEYLFRFNGMFCFIPWLKYWLTANRWCTELSIRFLTQVGVSMDDLNLQDIEREFVHCVSRFKLSAANREIVDNLGIGRKGKLEHYKRDYKFVPHYPHPPAGREYSMAMQCATFSLIVCTTHSHSHSPDGARSGTAGMVLSRSAAKPMYRVMAWRNNPYHLLSGWVEANISTGEPSQPEKRHGGEHPMWIVNSHNYSAAARDSRMSVGNVDLIFDRWIPFFVRFIRTNLQGAEKADECFQADQGIGYEEKFHIEN